MSNKFLFSNLPFDIINNILIYTGKLYYYNGKYIGKIDKNNIKYDKIYYIPKPIQVSYNKYNLYLINKDTCLGYIIHYTINMTENIIIMQLIFYRINDSKTIEWYVMPNIYSKWRRVISLSCLN